MTMELNQLFSLLLVVLLSAEEKALRFTNVTEQVGLSNIEGTFVVAAFSDANVDKHLDVLLVNKTDGEVYLMPQYVHALILVKQLAVGMRFHCYYGMDISLYCLCRGKKFTHQS